MGFSSVKPKRSLGQNFFINQNLGKNIVQKVLETEPNVVFEIGPGKGFFTQLFVQNSKKVICVEKDTVLAEKLKLFLPEAEILNEDILDFNFSKLENPVCFGSLPYNIAKKIISLILQSRRVKNSYFIVQKEVAEKYANKKKSSLLSLTTEIYADAKILLNISPHSFKPKPNVDSTLIRFTLNENFEKIKNTNSFLKYLHHAFKQPRKKLKNNLQKHYDIQDLNLDSRAQDLNFEEHLVLWKKLVI